MKQSEVTVTVLHSCLICSGHIATSTTRPVDDPSEILVNISRPQEVCRNCKDMLLLYEKKGD